VRRPLAATYSPNTSVGLVRVTTDRLSVWHVAEMLAIEPVELGVSFIQERAKAAHELATLLGKHGTAAGCPPGAAVQQLKPQVLLDVADRPPCLVIRHAHRLGRLMERPDLIDEHEEVENPGPKERLALIVEKHAMAGANARRALGRGAPGRAFPQPLGAAFGA